MADVLVVGAGPVGLTLAAELARHGTRCRLVDKAPAPLPYCRAIGVTPRTLEVWDDMGILRAAADAGLWLTGMRSAIAGLPVQDTVAPDLGLPLAQLGLPQYDTERILTAHLAKFGGEIERGVALTGLTQDADGVAVTLRRPDGTTEDARFAYVVGCDGAHSAVRKALGIDFPGEAYPWPFMLGDVHIDWDLPYGMALRAMRLRQDAPPDVFVAIPLPEAGRYRVSSMAPADLAPPGGTDHGIQTELAGPDLSALQAVADDLVPGAPRLSALRWSSLFRISVRIADAYGAGRVFIAGDATHIHPPTGGQGMNTGIQDAYNLAWKLALVLQKQAPAALLASYEAERRPVGVEVVERTAAATIGYGHEPGGVQQARLIETQTLVSYRGSPLVRDDAGSADGPRAGDRAPDVTDLKRPGFGSPLRLFDILKGTDHVLLTALPGSDLAAATDIASLATDLRRRFGTAIRVIAVAPAALPQAQGVVSLHDTAGNFAQTYGLAAKAWLIRPDGHIGWRGLSWRDDGLTNVLETLVGLRRLAP